MFLTGTLPPSMVREFERMMLLRGARMIRSPTARRDVHYGVSYCPPNRNLVRDFALPEIQAFTASLEPGTRAIIYCWLKNVAEEVAEVIRAPVYHSTSGSVKEKAAVLQQWREGEPPFIVATSAFGLGIDHPAVQQVIHVGMPRSMVDFAQEVGRLGRAGGGGYSVLLVPPQWKPATVDRDNRPIKPVEEAMQKYVSTIKCRVKELSRFLDGDTHECEPDALICDNCERAEKSLVEEFTLHTTDSDHEASESEKNNLADLMAGGELLHLQVQEYTRQREDYITSLHAWRGVCMICYHLPGPEASESSHAQHSLNRCRNQQRFRYFDAKRVAKLNGQQRGG